MERGTHCLDKLDDWQKVSAKTVNKKWGCTPGSYAYVKTFTLRKLDWNTIIYTPLHDNQINKVITEFIP